MRRHIFGERTGLKVPELALGTCMFGQTWSYGATVEDAKRIICPHDRLELIGAVADGVKPARSLWPGR
ncbi:MAG: hypothetical protein JWN13_1898 [Betaproteobacteria bacterium]|jgi:hypothetical protein|nr:hypothetical protein [Betaproteobacteria bacterium]